MANRIVYYSCRRCDRRTGHTKQSVNHLLHLVLSVFTAGLWLPVWFVLVVLSGMNPAYCVVCGTKKGRL